MPAHAPDQAVDFGRSVGRRNDHFSEQAEYEYLDADDDHERAHHEQRSIADPPAHEPADRQVGIDDESREADADAEPPKQVQRATPEAAQEKDRQQIERSAQDGSIPYLEARSAVPGGIPDLADLESFRMHQYRYVAISSP